MKYTLLIILFAFVSSFAQDESIKKMFEGKWKMDSDKSEIYEEWSIVNDNEIIGSSYIVKAGEKIISENIYIKKFAGYWTYIGIPEGQVPTLFTLIENTGSKFVFENIEHDYPQRVIYEFHNDSKLTAAIEGEINNELKRKEFHFTLIKD